MSLPTILGISVLAGAALGWVYFRALWATVQRLPRRPHPGRWFATSLLLRLALALAVFVAAAKWGGLPALAGTLVGFLVARTLAVRRIRGAEPDPARQP